MRKVPVPFGIRDFFVFIDQTIVLEILEILGILGILGIHKWSILLLFSCEHYFYSIVINTLFLFVNLMGFP